MNLDEWLEETAWSKPYWRDIKARATELNSDGCSGVPDWFGWTCLEHDVHYGTHCFLDGRKIDKETADFILRVRVQQGSYLGLFSPVAWIRWFGVRWFPQAQTAWDR